MAAAAALRLVQRRTLLSPARLMPARPVHSRSFAIVDENKEAAIHLAKIHQKKEELYSLTADFQSKYRFPGRMGRIIAEHNASLLQKLSVHVKPKPNDPNWRSHRRVQRLRGFLTFFGAFSIIHMIPTGFSWFTADPKTLGPGLVGRPEAVNIPCLTEIKS